MTNTDKIVGMRGCKVVSTTTTETQNFYYFIAQENTVVASVKTVFSGETAIESLTALGLSGYILKAGAQISCEGDYFSEITLTSGSVIIYKI